MASPSLALSNARSPLAASTSDAVQPLKYTRLDLDSETIDALKRSLKAEDTVELCCGKTPTLRIGDLTRTLNLSTPTFQIGLISSSGRNKDDIIGSITHAMTIEQSKKQLESVNVAQAKLRASLNAEAQRREENSMVLLNHDPRGLSKSKASSSLKVPLDHTRSPYQPPQLSSPAFTATFTPSSSNPQADPRHDMRMQAKKRALFHLLAIEPISFELLRTKTHIQDRDELNKLLTRHGKRLGEDNSWDLQPLCYKELDIWSFPYNSAAQRDSAQQNAVKAFDRLRISKEDPLWQKLLPLKDRNKGIILSKLNLNAAKSAGTFPSDHRKLLSGTGGEQSGRTKSSDSVPMSRNKNPLAHRSPLNKPVKKPSSPLPAKGEVKRKAEEPLAKNVSSKKVKTSNTKQYKSAEYVNDDDAEDELEGSTMSQVVPITRASNDRLAEMKKSSSDRSMPSSPALAGKNKQADDDKQESTRPTTAPRKETKSVRIVENAAKPSVSANSRLMPPATSKLSQTRTNPTTGATERKGSTFQVAMKDKVARPTIPAHEKAASKPNVSNAPDSAAKRDTLGAPKVVANSSGRNTTSKVTPNGHVDKVQPSADNSSRLPPATSFSKQPQKSNSDPKPSAHTHKPPRSDTSSSSGPSVFSPSPSHGHSSASSLASIAPALKKRPAPAQPLHADPAISNPSSSTKRSKIEKQTDPLSSTGSRSPMTPHSQIGHAETPGAISESGEDDSPRREWANDGSRRGNGSSADPSTSLHEEDASHPNQSHPPIAPQTSENLSGDPILPEPSSPPNEEHMSQYHTLQATYLPIFTDALHLRLTCEVLPTHLQTPARVKEWKDAQALMLLEMDKLKDLLGSMSPATLRAVGQDADEIAEKFRKEALVNQKGYARWDPMPDDYRTDDILGWRAFVVEWRERMHKEFVARRNAWDAMEEGEAKELERRWLFHRDRMVSQADQILGR